MKLFLVRHGESQANVANIINDDPSTAVNLTHRGIAQAKDASKLLCNIPFSIAYTSEFPRARQTAEILLRNHDLELKIDSRLNERRSGMNGLPVKIFNDLVFPDPLHIKPICGESFLEQMDRVRSFIVDVAKIHSKETVLAVTHENPIVAALALTVDDPESVIRKSIANCCWVELNWVI